MMIRDVVFEIISDIVACDREGLRPAQHLFQDLHMDADDASFELVPRLEEALHVNVPRREWKAVNTVQDVIDLLRRHVHT